MQICGLPSYYCQSLCMAGVCPGYEDWSRARIQEMNVHMGKSARPTLLSSNCMPLRVSGCGWGWPGTASGTNPCSSHSRSPKSPSCGLYHIAYDVIREYTITPAIPRSEGTTLKNVMLKAVMRPSLNAGGELAMSSPYTHRMPDLVRTALLPTCLMPLLCIS